jgi:hypothetical protein
MLSKEIIKRRMRRLKKIITPREAWVIYDMWSSGFPKNFLSNKFDVSRHKVVAIINAFLMNFEPETEGDSEGEQKVQEDSDEESKAGDSVDEG